MLVSRQEFDALCVLACVDTYVTGSLNNIGSGLRIRTTLEDYNIVTYLSGRYVYRVAYKEP